MDVSVRRERAECFAWQVLCIVGIVQGYHPQPRRRGAGVRCPERCGLWRPAMGSSCVVVDRYLGTI